MRAPEIPNFIELDARVATGGQPSEQQLGELADSGFDTVVNLGLLDPRYCLRDERGTVLELGMDYHHIPVDFKKPGVADYERFEAVMAGAAARKVFVHCAMNYRVSCFTALWAERKLGWSRSRADTWIARQWEPDAVWTEYVARVRQVTGSPRLRY